ncbi:MAG: GNAT family N-acetyltransferase, partial [Bacteroidota bacterium]|nr:GNAT family N-acetyltransferase [Bacteroidota bacterium]MDX5429676.1 GNAT family N-acetyltransferase [Bacteroidota bacterium]MDX5468454.1 GNAT family N-acetyltransferase [Bacteroidota bacterium]
MKFVEIAYKSEDWKNAVRLREKVLREPLGSFFSEEELEAEKDHIQIAGFVDDELIATAVLVPEGAQMKMQRVALREDLRNQAIGSRMMDFCENIAKQKEIKTLYCRARDTAVNFYLQNAYSPVGD